MSLCYIKKMSLDKNIENTYSTCRICSQLAPLEHAFQSMAREEENTYLPAASNDLVLIKNISSSEKLQQCPECGTYYRYQSIYEFLVYGSEEEQDLKRLSIEEAMLYQEQASKKCSI